MTRVQVRYNDGAIKHFDSVVRATNEQDVQKVSFTVGTERVILRPLGKGLWEYDRQYNAVMNCYTEESGL